MMKNKMKILLPFFDDSTLFFATSMYEHLSKKGLNAEIVEDVSSNGHVGVSERQFNEIAAGIPRKKTSDLFTKTEQLSQYSAVLISKTTVELRELLNSDYKLHEKRPKFVTFYPGLEFTPLKGFKNREFYDAIYFNNYDHLKLYKSIYSHREKEQYLSYGHPYLKMPMSQKEPNSGAVYFFAQALSPATYESRRHIVDILIAIAKKNPARKVVLKLRHLPNENTEHVHKEKYDYVSLLPNEVPENFELSAKNMKECLDDASIAITCTSTAAMDAISAGVNTLVYTEYVEYYQDKLARYMNKEFLGSNLLTSLDDLLHLRVSKPNDDWLKDNFRSEDFFDDITSYLHNLL